VTERTDEAALLPSAFLRACRRWRRKSKVADSTGVDLTGGTLLLRTLVLRRLLLRHVLKGDEKFVGILLPPSVAAVVANAVMPLCGRVAVNLNYTASSDILNHCLHQAGIRHVITSKRFMEKVPLKLDAELVYLEDFKDRASLWDKLAGAFEAFACPLKVLERRLGIDRLKPDELLTVIFTSGSTGQPKGVMLSFGNVGSNVSAINQAVQLTEDDVICGILPFFHSLGFTVTLWAPLALDIKAAYHFSPLEAQAVGKLCDQHRVTIMLSTPTFLRSYLKRIAPEHFASLDVVVAGAEKLPADLCDAFEQKYGVRPVEGYGTTELSPLVSVNIPPSRALGNTNDGVREGSVGRPVPGVKAKVVHPETGADLPAGEAGLLLIAGPNVMQGYLNQPDLTAKVIRDGWYVTGDMAQLDADGFITITGRQSRFSKIGGEMVPHGRVEELLQRIIAGDDPQLAVAVTAVADERKGERLLVLHTHTDKSPEQITRELAEAGLPNLWVPAPDSFFEVEEIPVLGTGKLDLQGVKTVAAERFRLKTAGRKVAEPKSSEP
jgi:acyl-[acyl-carrier-protein]-phospholipid O-acyltransferase/long-chain-fatty-acid--[acyl-carrier-protein] ligase